MLGCRPLAPVALALCGGCAINVVGNGTDAGGTPEATAPEVVACQSDADCKTSTCETATCNPATGACTASLKAGFCLVAGTCYTAGAQNPVNLCEVCAPAETVTSFVTCPDDATQCSDGRCRSKAAEGCTDDEDCASGWCAPTPDGELCSTPCSSDKECTEAGLSGFGCDTVQGMCAHRTVNVCLPCNGDEECASMVAKDARCVELVAGAGRFCGLACKKESECPTGLGCLDFKDAGGTEYKQCAPKDGQCACTAYHVASAATSPCGLGECSGKGETLCAEAGKPPAPCSAAAGAAEKCDQLDNDCDGGVDEDFKDASGAFSTDAHCGACGLACKAPDHGSSACQAGVDSYECSITCEAGWVLSAEGTCVADAVGACEPCVDEGDCAAGLACAAIGASTVCAATCAAGAACDAGYACKEVGAASYCLRADAGACKAAGDACGAAADCEDLNPCSVDSCTDAKCAYLNDAAYSEACEWPYGGDTKAKGNCVTGTRGCAAMVLEACAGQVGPSVADACDGADDDCDGQTDEACELTGFDMCLAGETYLSGSGALAGQTLEVEIVLGSPFEGGVMSGKDASGVEWEIGIGLFPLPLEGATP